MGYIVLLHKEDEAIQLSIASDADPTEVLEQLQVGIYIDVVQIKGYKIRLGIDAPGAVVVSRGELLERATA